MIADFPVNCIPLHMDELYTQITNNQMTNLNIIQSFDS